MLMSYENDVSSVRKAAARTRLLAAIARELWRLQGHWGSVVHGGPVRRASFPAFESGLSCSARVSLHDEDGFSWFPDNA